MNARLVEDRRNFDFSLLDDEVLDREDLRANQKALYWAIVRLARITGEADPPNELLSRKAGIPNLVALRRARTALVTAGLLEVVPRRNNPALLRLLPVLKARSAGTEPYHRRWGVGTTSVPAVGTEPYHQSVRNRTGPISNLRLETRERNGLSPLTPDQESGARKRYREAHGGEDPRSRRVLMEWLKAGGT